MKRSKLFMGSLIFLWLSAVIMAQPDPPRQVAKLGKGGGKAGQAVRQTEVLKKLGLSDKDLEAVTACVKEKTMARQELEVILKLSNKTLRGKRFTEDQAKDGLTVYRNAMKTFADRNTSAEKALEEALHYSKNPKIEFALLCLGVLDNGLPSLRSTGQAKGNKVKPPIPPVQKQ